MEPHVYPLGQRPQGFVLIDRVWRACEIRMRKTNGQLNIMWSADDGNRLDNVDAGDVRWD